MHTYSPHLIIFWQKSHMVLSPNESDWDCHALGGRMNPISPMNITVSLITHTNAMHKWSGFCPHKENGFSYASTCRFFWRFSVCTYDWELTVEWWVRFCWQLMKCVPDGLSVRTSCGWWKSDIESYINAISHRLLYISKIKSTEHLLHLYNSLNNKTLISSNFRFWHNLSVHQIFIYFFLWK